MPPKSDAVKFALLLQLLSLLSLSEVPQLRIFKKKMLPIQKSFLEGDECKEKTILKAASTISLAVTGPII